MKICCFLHGHAKKMQTVEVSSKQKHSEDIEAQEAIKQVQKRNLSTCAKVCKVLCNPQGKDQYDLRRDIIIGISAYAFVYTCLAVLQGLISYSVVQFGVEKVPFCTVAMVVTPFFAVGAIVSNVLICSGMIGRVESMKI